MTTTHNATRRATTAQEPRDAAPYTILGLDMSSTCIGYAVAHGDTIRRYGHCDLRGDDIARRCADARAYVDGLLDLEQPALVVIESPVARYAKAVIPQARVSGAVLTALYLHKALWHEAAPSVAKRLLAGDGAATKREMVQAAAQRLGLAGGPPCCYRGKWGVWDGNPVPLLTEDEADAIALALVGAALPIVIKGRA